MKIAIDESRPNLTFDSDQFEASVLCALIVPDSRLNDVEQFAAHLRAKTQRGELKAAKMRPKHVFMVAEFLAAHKISAVAFVTDNEVMPGRLVDESRLRQAAEIAEERHRVAETNAHHPMLLDLDELIDRVAGCATARGISRVEFVQSQQMPELILESVRRAYLRYQRREWRGSFERFQYAIDRKIQDQLGSGERYVDENLERMLALTPRLVLDLPIAWRDQLDHPFHRFRDVGGGRTVLGDLLRNRHWVDSRDDDCVQLADIVAGTVRMAVEKGSNSSRRKAYDVLRHVLADEHGETLRMYRFPGSPEPDLERYAPLLRAWPAAARYRRITPAGAVLLG